ncbi:MAG TPA: hypothetical protein VFL83_14740 [Anaeromyxobacter sp.]|nr:hypothetical protein [Anaeromyxobacter sp.]
MRSRRTVIALLLAPAAVGRAEDPAAPAPVPEAAAPSGTIATAPPEPAVAWSRFSVHAGWGYYEVSHAGASYHLGPRAALGLFGGWGLGRSEQDGTLGVSYAHAVLAPAWGWQPGWAAKAIYWTQSDPNYDWKNLSLVLGPRFVADFGDGLRLALDAGVALTFALESDRKQEFNFGSPTRWNGSVCLEIEYRLGGR